MNFSFDITKIYVKDCIMQYIVLNFLKINVKTKEKPQINLGFQQGKYFKKKLFECLISFRNEYPTLIYMKENVYHLRFG